MHVLAPTDATSLSEERRRRLATTLYVVIDEMVQSWLVSASAPAEDAISIEGCDEFEPAPLHVWLPVVVQPIGWSFEWTLPLMDLHIHREPGPIEIGPLVTELGAGDNWFDDDWEPPAAIAAELVEWPSRCVIECWDFAIAIHSRAVTIDVAGEVDESGLGPPDLDLKLVELVHSMTGWAYRGETYKLDEYPPRVRDRRIAAACRLKPIAEAKLRPDDSARRFLAALQDAGAIRLSADASGGRVVAIVRRLLADASRVEQCSAELLACPQVDDIYIDDATLAALAAAW